MDMNLEVHRLFMGDKATEGELYMDGVPNCVTLEDIVRDLGPNGEGKVFGQTAIPAGTYSVTIRLSPKFGHDFMHIEDVPFFDGILIHSGNTDQNTEGCILVGQKVVNNDYIQGGSVELPILFGAVKNALDSGGKVQITISDDFKTNGNQPLS